MATVFEVIAEAVSQTLTVSAAWERVLPWPVTSAERISPVSLAGLVDSRWRTLGRHEEAGVTFEHRLDRRQVGVDDAPQQVIADAHRRLGVLGPAHAQHCSSDT